MERINYAVKFLLLLGIVFALLPGCSEDNAGMPAGTDIVGTWTTSQSEIDASAGGMSAHDYLVNVVGLSPTDATVYYAIWEAQLKTELVGSITFNSDHTYTSNFGSSPDDGTWTLSSDNKTLTLDSGTADEQVLEVTMLTGSTLVVVLNQDIPVDLDNDPNTPDIPVTTAATITLTK
jgi:Lipocalin-like domain